MRVRGSSALLSAACASGSRHASPACGAGHCASLGDRVFSRSWHGLWNTIKLKMLRYNLMLHYNLCQAGVLPLPG